MSECEAASAGCRWCDAREEELLDIARGLLAEEISEGETLRILRRDVLGLSQEAYAKLVGISRRMRRPLFKWSRPWPKNSFTRKPLNGLASSACNRPRPG